MKKKIIVGLIIVFMLAASIWVRNFLAVDSCLDEGGRWNYELGECEFE